MFFIETDWAHLPLAEKTESTILEKNTYTSFEIEQACSIFLIPIWNLFILANFDKKR